MSKTFFQNSKPSLENMWIRSQLVRIHTFLSLWFDVSISIMLKERVVLNNYKMAYKSSEFKGAQWLGGRMLDSRPRGRGFEPHRRHCIVVLEQDTVILA